MGTTAVEPIPRAQWRRPVLRTFTLVAEVYLPPTAALGTWATMSPAQGHPGSRSSSLSSPLLTWKPKNIEDTPCGQPHGGPTLRT